MKNKILAIVLCLTMVLTSGSFAFAADEPASQATETAVTAEQPSDKEAMEPAENLTDEAEEFVTQTVSLYEQLMGAETIAELCAVFVDAAETDKEALSKAEINAIFDRVEELDPEGTSSEVEQIVNILIELPNFVSGAEEDGEEASNLATTTNQTWQGQRFSADSVQELGNNATITLRNLTTDEINKRKQKANFVVPDGVTLTIKGYGSFARASDNPLSLIYVEKGGKLVIEGTSKEKPIIIDGKNTIANAPLIYSQGTVEIKNAVIQNGKNRSVYAESHEKAGKPNGQGGGIYITTTGSLKIDNSVITRNTASLDGGGIYCRGPMNITDSTISYNRAGSSETGTSVINAGRGGGFHLNQATGIGVLNNVTITENAAVYYGGGGQVSNGGHLTMNGNTKFSSNRAILHGAGALHVTGAATFIMNDGVMENNTAQTVGGAIHSSYTCVLELNKGKILGNTANGRGGGVHINTGGALTLNNQIEISGNTANNQATGSYLDVDATGDNWSNARFEGAHIDNGYGGGVLIDSGTCTVAGAKITDNAAAVGGGGIALVMLNVTENSLSHILPVSFAMTSGEISNNTTYGNGAGVYMMSNKAKENIMKLYGDETTEKYQEAIAKLQSLDILTAIPEASVSGGTINNNNATGNGGGLYLAENTKFIISGTGDISENSAVDGAGAYVASGTAEINGGTMFSNIATSEGGALYISGTVNMSGGQINKNVSTTNGGGVYITNGDFTMTSGKIIENQTTAEDSNGGGIYVEGGNIEIGIENCTGEGTNHTVAPTNKIHPIISDNTAKDSGGGIALIGNGNIEMHCGSITTNNVINRGRGLNIYMEDGSFHFRGGNVGQLASPELVIVGGQLVNHTTQTDEVINLNYYHCNLDNDTHIGALATKIASATKDSYFNLPDGEKYWEAAEGFRFFGWTFNGPGDDDAKDHVRDKKDYKELGTPIQAVEDVDGSADDDTIHMYALWAPEQSRITYAGLVIESEDVVEGTAVVDYEYRDYTDEKAANPEVYNFEIGSNVVTLQPPVKPGYTFEGWYLYQDEGQNANWGINYEPVYVDGTTEAEKVYANLDYAEMADQFLPANEDGTYDLDMGNTNFGNITLIAKFVPEYTSLIITKDVMNASPDQTFLFQVTGTPDNNELAPVDLTVTICGAGSTTIKELPVGDYNVTEITDWSWRYELTEIDDQTVAEGVFGKAIEACDPDVTYEADFTNVIDNDYWLSGDAYKANLFKSAIQ